MILNISFFQLKHIELVIASPAGEARTLRRRVEIFSQEIIN